MKYLAITMMLFFNINLFGQVRNFNDIPKDILKQLDKMGIDDSQLLNSHESAFLNVIFKDSLKGFDFTNKKIGFLSAGSKRNKKEFFKEERERYYNNSTTINGALYIFDATQKEESGGYDAAIVYWSKRLISIRDIVKRLK
jgi:hypothetical protein